MPTLPVNYPLIKGFSVVGVRAGEFGRRDPLLGRENIDIINSLAEDNKIRPHILQKENYYNHFLTTSFGNQMLVDTVVVVVLLNVCAQLHGARTCRVHELPACRHHFLQRGNEFSGARGRLVESLSNCSHSARRGGGGIGMSLHAGLNAAIVSAFGTMAMLKRALSLSALEVFGSGWAWLALDRRSDKLVVQSTPNQDTPAMDASTVPLLGIDVWEHAYYLKHQSRRKDCMHARARTRD